LPSTGSAIDEVVKWKQATKIFVKPMKPAAVTSALLVLLAEMLAVSSPAEAEYECITRTLQGDPLAQYQQETVTIRHPDNAGTTVQLQRLLNFEAPAPLRRRFFIIYYYAEIENPLKANYLEVTYPARLKQPIRPLFVFLRLDSGEQFEHLVMDAQGHRWEGYNENAWSKEVMSTGTTVGLYVQDTVFLGALEKAKTLTVELKYDDGEILERETYDFNRTEFMQRALEAAIESSKNTKNCRVVPQPIEF
jgi:hypothetical protein